MADIESVDVEVDEVVEADEQEAEAPKVESIEDVAKDLGWFPKEEYKGDNWTDAATFIRNTGAISKKEHISNVSLRRDLDEVKRNVKKTLQFQGELKQKEIDSLRAQLKAEKREAVKEGDVDEVDNIDKRLEELDNAKADKADDDDMPPEFTEWHENNPWYGGTGEDDDILTTYADGVAARPSVSGKPPKEAYAIIDREVAKFKAKLTPKQTVTSRKTVNAVAGGGSRPNRSSIEKTTYADLNDEQRAMARSMVQQGIFKDEQEWIDALLAKQRGVK